MIFLKDFYKPSTYLPSQYAIHYKKMIILYLKIQSLIGRYLATDLVIFNFFIANF